MSTWPAARRAYREPDNELYDRGCDLVEAAAAIARTAAAPEAARALPAALGCIEAAVQELLVAVAAMEKTTAAKTTGRRAEHTSQAIDLRMHRGYANLRQALDDAHGAAAAARSLTSRALNVRAAFRRRHEG